MIQKNMRSLKERREYYKRKEAGKIKEVSQLTDREKRAQRKKWVQKQRKSRSKKAQENALGLNVNTPPNSDQEAVTDNIENAHVVIGRAGVADKTVGRR